MTRSRRAVFAAAPAVLAASFAAWLVFQPSSHPALAAAPADEPAAKGSSAGKDAFAESVKPVLAKYCVTCHNDKKMSGGMTLEPYTDAEKARKAHDLWEKVKEHV